MADMALILADGVALPTTVALGAVALIGYLFGRSQNSAEPSSKKRPEEFIRAAEIAHQLETIADTLRRDLASHHAQVEQFKRVIEKTDTSDHQQAWKELSEQAEQVLAPTLRLVGQVASAYDQIRQQSKALSNFTGGRTDALTGLCNSRALHELLEMELGGHQASRADFSIAVVNVHGRTDQPTPSKEERQDQILMAAELVKKQLRDNDLVARYGVDEFVVVMPHTRLFGASIFGRRLRKALADHASLVANCGLTQSLPGDTAKSLLSRADSALYSAKQAFAESDSGAADAATSVASSVTPTLKFDRETGSQYLHTGSSIVADNPVGSELGVFSDEQLANAYDTVQLAQETVVQAV